MVVLYGISDGITHWVDCVVLIDRKWYMFRNMGPKPTPRSGHAMARVGSKAIVLGGLPGVPVHGVDPKDTSLLHVLQTSACCSFLFFLLIGRLWDRAQLSSHLTNLIYILELIKYPKDKDRDT